MSDKLDLANEFERLGLPEDDRPRCHDCNRKMSVETEYDKDGNATDRYWHCRHCGTSTGM